MAIDPPLPVLDFALFSQGSTIERKAFARDLVKSFQDHAFVKLINHGLPEETVRACMQGAVDFFALSSDAKRHIANVRGPWPQRGFSYAGDEQTSKLRKENMVGQKSFDGLLDQREHFDAGPRDDMEYPNRWPTDEELPGFRALIEECFDTFQATCIGIMKAMEVGLDLPKHSLVRRCIPAASELRLNHYPPTDLRTLADGKVRRTWPHTDFGIITLLFQDQIGGLELEDRRRPGSFIPVTAGDHNGQTVMVVNISDTLQRWTNDAITAGLHQVTVPPAMKGRKAGIVPERYSSIFFFKADRNTSVGPLPEFVDDEHPALYDEINALQFQQLKTKMLY